jgi:hypothetical protein
VGKPYAKQYKVKPAIAGSIFVSRIKTELWVTRGTFGSCWRTNSKGSQVGESLCFLSSSIPSLSSSSKIVFNGSASIYCNKFCNLETRYNSKLCYNSYTWHISGRFLHNHCHHYHPLQTLQLRRMVDHTS